MILEKEKLDKQVDNMLKVKLKNGNFLRGRLREYVEHEGNLSIVLQSYTYTFQVDQNDIESIESISTTVW